jgi:hypothetical protein
MEKARTDSDHPEEMAAGADPKALVNILDTSEPVTLNLDGETSGRPKRPVLTFEQKVAARAAHYVMVYATSGTSECRFSVSYNHATRPEFSWLEFDTARQTIREGTGHPRRNGFTKANGWTLNPEWQGADW